MSVLESLRKGIGIVMMSFGISSPKKKAKPAVKPTVKPGQD
jgi:hypothetical protein